MEQPTTIKTIIYTILSVFTLAGGVFSVGKWTGRKNRDTEEIEKLKDTVEENENKAKARLYGPDGSLLFVRAEIYNKDQNAVRADISAIEKKQQAHEISLVKLESIDRNVTSLVDLFKTYIKNNSK